MRFIGWTLVATINESCMGLRIKKSQKVGSRSNLINLARDSATKPKLDMPLDIGKTTT